MPKAFLITLGGFLLFVIKIIPREWAKNKDNKIKYTNKDDGSNIVGFQNVILGLLTRSVLEY